MRKFLQVLGWINVALGTVLLIISPFGLMGIGIGVWALWYGKRYKPSVTAWRGQPVDDSESPVSTVRDYANNIATTNDGAKLIGVDQENG